MAERKENLNIPGQFPEYGDAMAEMNLIITDDRKPVRKHGAKGGTKAKDAIPPTLPSPERKQTSETNGRATHIKMTPALNDKFSKAHFLHCYRMQKMIPKTEFLSLVLDEWLERNGG